MATPVSPEEFEAEAGKLILEIERGLLDEDGLGHVGTQGAKASDGEIKSGQVFEKV